MIIMSQIYTDMLRASMEDETLRSDFKRLIVRTRFEEYSDYLWEKLNCLKCSFIFNLDENTWVNRRNMIHKKREIVDALSLLIFNMMRGTPDIGLYDNRTGDCVPITDLSVVDEIYSLYRYQYCSRVDSSFVKSFKPRDYKNAVVFTNGTTPETLIRKQKLALAAITRMREHLCAEEIGVPEYFAPNKNLLMHSAMSVIRTVCEPKYDRDRINNALKSLGCINSNRNGAVLDNICIEELAFWNDAVFSNNDYRTIYDVLKLLGFVRMNEECDSRDSAKYMRSVDSQSKNVDMLAIYITKSGMDGNINLRRIVRMSQNFIKNDPFILTDKQDVDFAFMQ